MLSSCGLSFSTCTRDSVSVPPSPSCTERLIPAMTATIPVVEVR
jgi:hypothetical protein